MNNDVVLLILRFLDDVEDMRAAALVCKQFAAVVSQHNLMAAFLQPGVDRRGYLEGVAKKIQRVLSLGGQGTTNVKIIVGGAAGTGKTALMIRWMQDAWYEDPNYDITGPSRIESIDGRGGYRKQFIVEGCDGQFLPDIGATRFDVEFQAMRDLIMENGEVLCLLYDSTRVRETLEECRKLLAVWQKVERTQLNVIVVATKADLMHDPKVRTAEGLKFAQEIGAAYVVCSAKSGFNARIVLDEVFLLGASLKLAEESPNVKREKCCLF